MTRVRNLACMALLALLLPSLAAASGAPRTEERGYVGTVFSTFVMPGGADPAYGGNIFRIQAADTRVALRIHDATGLPVPATAQFYESLANRVPLGGARGFCGGTALEVPRLPGRVTEAVVVRVDAPSATLYCGLGQPAAATFGRIVADFN